MKQIKNWMKKNWNIVAGALVVILFCVVMVYNEKKKIYEFSSNLFYMDTYIQVKVYTHDATRAKEALQDVEKIYKEYHELTDHHQAYGDLINLYTIYHNTLSDETLTLDPRLYDLLSYALQLEEKTNGLFKINLGNVIDVWNKYRTSKEGIPTIEELKDAHAKEEEVILLSNYQIKNNHANIDLGAIAKGYTTNVAANYLKEIGFEKFLINAGGNVVVGDYYTDGSYKIGIETPTEKGGVYQIITGNNMAVTTSGSYERFYTYNGQVYHHIIDPISLFPPNYMKSVTVITKDSALGDVLSTTLFLMPIEQGKEFLKENYPDVEAIWYGMDDEVTKTEGFSQYE